MAGMADLSFEAESPVMPPDELLEGLPSYDWLLQGRGESEGSWVLQLLPRTLAGWVMVRATRNKLPFLLGS